MISGESNDDVLKMWDLRKFKKHCNDNCFNILHQEFTMKEKVGGLATGKKPVRGRKSLGKLPFIGFTHYTSEIAEYHKQMKLDMEKFEVRELPMADGEHRDDLSANKEHLYHIAQIGRSNPLAASLKQCAETKSKGYSSLCVHPDSNLLLANSISNSLYLFNASRLDLDPPLQFTGHKVSYYCKRSPPKISEGVHESLGGLCGERREGGGSARVGRSYAKQGTGIPVPRGRGELCGLGEDGAALHRKCRR